MQFVLLAFASNAQSPGGGSSLYERELSVSPRIGYDLPFFNNNTPYIDYKGGIEYGLSIDYYWKKFGLGADFDYMGNRTKSTYPTTNIFIVAPGFPISNFTVIERKIERMFYGIGPDFRWKAKGGKFSTELNTRVGVGHIKGGLVDHRGTFFNGVANVPVVLNYHHGYNDNFNLAAKGQLRFNYLLSQRIGVNAGAYYLHHFGVEDLEAVPGIAAWHQPLQSVPAGQEFNGPPSSMGSQKSAVSSVGVFVGLSFILKSKDEKKKKGKYTLAVTAKDKFTKQLIPEAEVVLKNNAGQIVSAGKTNAYGVVMFENLAADN